MNLRNTFASLLVVAVTATAAFGDVPQGVLTLSGGDAVSGAFENSHEPNILRWQGKHFLSPFEFDVSTVSSVNFPTQQPPAQLTGELAVELASGDMFTGRLLQWNDQHLEIESVHFGVVHVKAESVRRIYRLTENPLLVYSGLTGVAGWDVHDTEWREDGPFLETSQDDAKISGDFQIPDKAMIEFELSWPQKPNFALVLAADPDLKEDKRQDGWRLEMWDQLLGVLREHKDVADVDRVAMILPSVKRVHLIAYLDQLAGTIQIFTADGSPAGKISVPPVKDAKPGRGIRLVNRHGTIRLERLRIARWNGQLPTSIPKGEIAYHLGDGTTQLGIPQGFDANSREHLFKAGDEVKRLSEAEVVMVERGPPEAVQARSMATMLQDGTRLSGQLERVEAASLVVQCPDISEALTIPQIGVRALVMSPTAAEEVTVEAGGRLGRLTIDGQNLAGWLIDGTKNNEAACFVWKPKTSRTSSAIKNKTAGEIVYRETRKAVPAEQAQVRERPGANFLDIFLQKANTPPAQRSTTVDHNIHLRSGDIIPCNVLSIAESGVAIKSNVTESQVIPHAAIKAIELIRNKLPDLEAAKKQRLLTLPRLLRSSPPTHLLCSQTGDFLRCRVVRMNDERLVVEIQLEEIEIPRNRISHIIWFHPDELEEQKPGEESAEQEAEVADAESGDQPEQPAEEVAADTRPDFSEMAQVLQAGGNRVTFQPELVEGTNISGTSDILGTCQFDLSALERIVFGGAIDTVVADLVYSQWKMTPAIEPLIAQETEDGGSDMGGASPLVGKPAPAIKLALLGGGEFDLAKEKGHVVVLDFWATWCGPCMQTMPLVEEALKTYNPEQVRLIAVNLEEPEEQIREVMERHELHATVALDVDGVTARRYQANAIPQLVIVDQDGNVAKLYVGGGPGTVAQMRESIDELLSPPATDAPMQ